MMWGVDTQQPTTETLVRPGPHETPRTLAENFETLSDETLKWFASLDLIEQKLWVAKMRHIVDARKRGLFDEMKLAPVTYEEQRQAESARKHLEFARWLVEQGRLNERA